MQTLRCQAKRISGDRNEQRISRNEWLWLIHLLQNVTDRQTLRNINWTNDTVLNKTSVKQEITIIIVRLAPFQWFQLRLMPITSIVVSGWPLYSHDQIPRLFPDFSATFHICTELFVWLTMACLPMLLSRNVFRHSLHLAEMQAFFFQTSCDAQLYLLNNSFLHILCQDQYSR